jgi:hypothetical protein
MDIGRVGVYTFASFSLLLISKEELFWDWDLGSRVGRMGWILFNLSRAVWITIVYDVLGYIVYCEIPLYILYLNILLHSIQHTTSNCS